jgi:hypothetical protein
MINAVMIKRRKKNFDDNRRILKNALFVVRSYLSLELSTFNDFLLQTIQLINEIFRINNDIFRNQIDDDS